MSNSDIGKCDLWVGKNSIGDTASSVNVIAEVNGTMEYNHTNLLYEPGPYKLLNNTRLKTAHQ